MRAGLAGFVGLVALLHLLRADDLPAADHFISEYARGGGVVRFLMVAAFLCWAASLALLGRAWHGIVRWSLLVAAVGALGAGLFTTETVAGELPAGVERTLEGRLHDWATLLIFAGLTVASIATAVVVRRWSFRLAVLGLGLTLFAIVPVLLALGLDAPGIGQRGFVLVGVAWQALATREALRDLDPTRPAPG